MRNGIIFFIFLMIFSTLGMSTPKASSIDSYEAQTIPDEAIRLRILANSDEDHDQQIKHIVRDEVNAYITEKVQFISDIEEGRKVIAESVPEIQEIAAQTLENNGIDQTVHVEYGSNITFPLKVYDQYVYPPGEYEAVLITIGEGKGANWWCVLFPPLCFLDFSNGTVVAEEDEDSETEQENPEAQEEPESQEEHESDEESEIDEEQEEDQFVVKFFLFEWLGLS